MCELDAEIAALCEQLFAEADVAMRVIEAEDLRRDAFLAGAEWTPEQVAQLRRPKPSSDRMAVGD